MNDKEVIRYLKSISNKNEKDLAGMARFGINTENALVISIPKLRQYAKTVIKNESPKNRHEIAINIWNSKIHEARILAGFIDDPYLVTEKQIEKWVKDFDSWDVCDLVCSNLFDKTKFAYQKAEEWSKRKEEFVKRAGFVLMAALSVHDKKMEDKPFLDFLEIIKRESWDERNFVRKAINWALRQISKSRSLNLYKEGLRVAYQIKRQDSKAARWIANNAIIELEKDYIKNKFGR